MKLNLADMTPGQTTDEWHPLCPVSLTSRGGGEAGSLRASVRYLHEVIMPIKEYASLKEVTMAMPIIWISKSQVTK